MTPESISQLLTAIHRENLKWQQNQEYNFVNLKELEDFQAEQTKIFASLLQKIDRLKLLNCNGVTHIQLLLLHKNVKSLFCQMWRSQNLEERISFEKQLSELLTDL